MHLVELALAIAERFALSHQRGPHWTLHPKQQPGSCREALCARIFSERHGIEVSLPQEHQGIASKISSRSKLLRR